MQINRLFEIIYILLEKKSITAKELAERFEVSVRTIYRDIDTLSSAGIPVYMTKGKGGGISLLSGYVLNKTVLTEEERVDILSSLKAVQSVDLSGSSSTLNKLSNILGDKNADWIEVDFLSWSDGVEEKAFFEALKNAIIRKNTITFSYCNGKGEYSTREAEPLKVCFKGQGWYLYSFCKQKQDYRFFKLKRMKHLVITDATFDREAPNQIFSQREEYTTPFVTIKMKISKELAYRVYDEFSQYSLDENGDYIVTFHIPETNWVYSFISTFGKYAKVMEPEYIKNNYKLFLEETLKQYL